MRKKSVYATVIVLSFLLGAVAVSHPGRSTIKRVFSRGAEEELRTNAGVSGEPVQAEDLESRARARHGWSAGVLNSVMRGTVTFYESDGTNTGQATMVVSRAYPSLLRLELTRGGNTEVWGFDGLNAWRSGDSNLGEGRARDIRQWLRICPERLFTTRSTGAAYREVGSRMEDLKPGRPWQGQSRINPPTVFEQVEMEDTLGLPPITGRPGDRRRITYYINQQDFTIETARWLEPDNPRRGMDENKAALIDVRVDFGGWRRVDGVLWPTDIVHWQGGRVDYRITVNQVQTNQPLADAIFQRP